jgi:hypothetical protein
VAEPEVSWPILISLAVTLSEPKPTNAKRSGRVKAARIAILAGSGGALGAIVDQGARGAGIGAGAGAAVGLAAVLLTRGREVELWQGTALDVVFDRPVALE